MKKLIFILLIIFASCEKDSTIDPCWYCIKTLNTTCYDANNVRYDYTSFTEPTYCDPEIDEEMIRKIEDVETKSWEINSDNGGICLFEQTMVCHKEK